MHAHVSEIKVNSLINGCSEDFQQGTGIANGGIEIYGGFITSPNIQSLISQSSLCVKVLEYFSNSKATAEG